MNKKVENNTLQFRQFTADNTDSKNVKPNKIKSISLLNPFSQQKKCTALKAPLGLLCKLAISEF